MFRVFQAALLDEIITAHLRLFDSLCLLLLEQGQAAPAFLAASGLGEEWGL